jgi:magnesium chelatase family protein
MVTTTHTVSLQGAIGHVVDVQADLSDGLIGTALVGRPDTSITEARDRCRAAVVNSGFTWPNTRRTTILLSPADLPKRGPHFDLAIAVAVLAAADREFPRSSLRGAAMIGELTLDGRIRCVPGVLPMTMAAAARGIDTVYVPEPQAAEASMVSGVQVFGIRSLSQVVALLKGDPVPHAAEVEPMSGSPLLTWRGEERLDDLDMADVLGMKDARYGVEVAAAGGHHLMLTGPKGSGKTTLAERIPGLLPDLDDSESLELTAVHSLCGALPPGASRIVRPPFRAPHHSASRTGILGGGSGRVRPGEVSKAHLGVLFLDEFPLFPTDVVEALREPLEAGEISISRGEEDATYPARSMFVFACNPCRCGEYHPYVRDNDCSCGEVKRREYRRKISGPIADRVDITRFVEPVARERHGSGARLPFDQPEPTAVIRARVEAARERQRQRYSGHPWRLNVHAPGPMLRDHWQLTDGAALRLDTEVHAGRLTRRGAVRVHRVAWSVADLAGVSRPGVDELDVALRLRSATPLLLSTVTRSADVTGRPA